MRLPGIYLFDDVDPELSLLPFAARRALDCAGLHLSLSGWQKLALEARQTLVRLGAEELVDRGAVERMLEHGDDVRPEPALCEPAPELGPSAELLTLLPEAHGLTAERWARLSGLDRYVLLQLSRRGKRERLAQAWAEIRGLSTR
jgi:hypothetical protein